jgi:hypothetical protein
VRVRPPLPRELRGFRPYEVGRLPHPLCNWNTHPLRRVQYVLHVAAEHTWTVCPSPHYDPAEPYNCARTRCLAGTNSALCWWSRRTTGW